MSAQVWTAWELTAQISPRPRVRVAAVDAYGRITNEFPGRGMPVGGDCPTSTWAMMLADAAGLYRFICFDLDAKHGRADVDAGKLSLWLYDLAIPHLVTQSGPSGGRHVWIALEEGVDATLVHQVGQFAKRLLPTLDLSQFNNVRTGAIRPPGAPHRDGGESRVIQGELITLIYPTVDSADVRRLLEHLLEVAGPLPAAIAPRKVQFVELDDAQRPQIVSRGSRVSLKPAPMDGDASAIMASAMARYAHAGWTFEQVLAIAPTSPAFTHAYTERVGGGARVARPANRTRRILERQWNRVASWVQHSPDAFTASDPDFDARATALVASVVAVQARADASPGRWARHGAGTSQSVGTGRYTDRLILDSLCYLALQAVNGRVEASTRTLSRISGVGRETARTALLRLHEDGWIVLDVAAEGVRAAQWRLRELSTTEDDKDRSQVFPPPAPATGAALRKLHLETLGTRLRNVTNDVFAAPHSLGRTAGRIYAALPSEELVDVAELSRRALLPPAIVRRYLRSLTKHHLVTSIDGYWQRFADRREHVAVSLGVDGYLVDRERRYSAEREAWAWWQSELEHRRAPAGRRRRRRHATQLGLLTIAGAPPEFPIHPRRRDGRADFAAARQALLAGILIDELPQTRQPAQAA